MTFGTLWPINEIIVYTWIIGARGGHGGFGGRGGVGEEGQAVEEVVIGEDKLEEEAVEGASNAALLVAM